MAAQPTEATGGTTGLMGMGINPASLRVEITTRRVAPQSGHRNSPHHRVAPMAAQAA